MTGRTAPRCVEADPAKLRDDRIADPLECLGVFLDAPVRHQELPGLDGPFGTLEMVEYVPLDGSMLLGLLDFVPNLGEPAVVAATEVLPGDDPLPVEGRERLVEPVAVRRRPPPGLLGLVCREQLGGEPLNLGLEVLLELPVGEVVAFSTISCADSKPSRTRCAMNSRRSSRASAIQPSLRRRTLNFSHPNRLTLSFGDGLIKV